MSDFYKNKGANEEKNLANEIFRKLEVMKNERKVYEPMWNKAAEMCAVSSNLFYKDEYGRCKQNIFDTTARNALTCFAASMKSIIVPTTSRWHRLKATNPKLDNNPNVKKYLECATDLLFRVRYGAKSNFASESDLLFNQLGIYGHCLWMVDDDIGKGIVYRCIPVCEAYIKRNDRGGIDTVMREYELSAKEAYKKFGDDVSYDIKKAVSESPERRFKFIHAVFEKKQYNKNKKDKGGMRFASVHLDVASKKIVQEGDIDVVLIWRQDFWELRGVLMEIVLLCKLFMIC